MYVFEHPYVFNAGQYIVSVTLSDAHGTCTNSNVRVQAKTSSAHDAKVYDLQFRGNGVYEAHVVSSGGLNDLFYIIRYDNNDIYTVRQHSAPSSPTTSPSSSTLHSCFQATPLPPSLPSSTAPPTAPAPYGHGLAVSMIFSEKRYVSASFPPSPPSAPLLDREVTDSTLPRILKDKITSYVYSPHNNITNNVYKFGFYSPYYEEEVRNAVNKFALWFSSSVYDGIFSFHSIFQYVDIDTFIERDCREYSPTSCEYKVLQAVCETHDYKDDPIPIGGYVGFPVAECSTYIYDWLTIKQNKCRRQRIDTSISKVCYHNPID